MNTDLRGWATIELKLMAFFNDSNVPIKTRNAFSPSALITFCELFINR